MPLDTWGRIGLFGPFWLFFEKPCQKNNFLIFSNHIAFLVEQIVTDNVDIEKYDINRSDLQQFR